MITSFILLYFQFYSVLRAELAYLNAIRGDEKRGYDDFANLGRASIFLLLLCFRLVTAAYGLCKGIHVDTPVVRA